MKVFGKFSLYAFFFYITLFETLGQSVTLEESFNNPPNHARPQAWWHWMNGNVTKEGIVADLEAMKNIGMGGVQILDIGSAIPEGPVATGSALQMEAYRTAIETANKLDMELVTHNCPGWSSSGGPWVTPEYSMKQFVWNEKSVVGNGNRQRIWLAQPYTKLGFYKDIKIIAFPVPEDSQDNLGKKATIFMNENIAEQFKLIDEDWASFTKIVQAPGENKGYLQYNFEQPVSIQSVTIIPAMTDISGIFQTSDDGISFQDITRFKLPRYRNQEALECFSFNPVKTRFFRIVFNGEAIVRDILISSGPRINNLASKAFYAVGTDPQADYNRQVDQKWIINPNKIIDVSTLVDENGVLHWNVPAGKWTIMRFGYTASGQRNIATSTSGDGLEIDKLDAKATERHFYEFFGHIKESLGEVLGSGFHRTFIDSYEVGMQNWTAKLPEEMIQRKGYEIFPYLPVLSGRFVGDVITSEQFLWDFRQVLSGMFAHNYVGRFRELCKENGMLLSIEGYGDGPLDDFAIGGQADIPMGEFWARLMHDMQRCKLPAMTAHTYGMRIGENQIIEAEAFTGSPEFTAWRSFPYALKAQGDLVFCLGVNRMVFHRYAHQPHLTATPGMTMGRWGFHFERTNNWFDKAGPWITYLSRCQYLLQQGNIVADICYFGGENSKVECLREYQLNPAPPVGYDYDIVNAEILLNKMKVKNGKLVLPDGVSYSVLVIPEQFDVLSFPLLRKIEQLVQDGAHIYCLKPQMSPSLSDKIKFQPDEYDALVKKIWGESDKGLQRKVGKGTIYWNLPLEKLLNKLRSPSDFDYRAENPDAVLNYIHRIVKDEIDIYFVANRKRQAENVYAAFRVENKIPELWNPETGKIERAVDYFQNNGKIWVPIRLEEAGSVFVVFRQKGSIPNGKLPQVPAYLAEESDENDNYSMSAWVKPEINMVMPVENLEKKNNDFGKGFIVYPHRADLIYGKGHSGSGFAVGVNGIAVFEKSEGMYAAVLVSPQKIEGWTHIAIVYRNGMPELYINGHFVKKGISSGLKSHSSVGYPHKERDVPYSESDYAKIEHYQKALSQSEILNLYRQGIPQPELPIDGNAFILTLQDKWQVCFSSTAKCPQPKVMEQLYSWIKSEDDDLKYFSGTATYAQSFHIDINVLAKSGKLYLDLGRVEVLARVRMNGHDLGVLWKPPYRINITDHIQPGINNLEIDVTNLWPNRLIGDAAKTKEYSFFKAGSIIDLPDWYKDGKKMPKGERSTFTTWEHYTKNDPLLESGLLGPVRIFAH